MLRSGGWFAFTAMLRAQPEAAHEAIRLAVRQDVTKLEHDGRLAVPVPAALSAARKP